MIMRRYMSPVRREYPEELEQDHQP
jgi:hypothetical protein